VLAGKRVHNGYRGKFVDHDKKTGKVRGVLCNKCNTGIGKLGDSLDGVFAAYQYLLRAKG